MRSSVTIYNAIDRVKKEQAAASNGNGKDREAKMFECQGRINQLEDELRASLEAEDAIRMSGAGHRVGGSDSAASATEQMFGTRASFAGVKSGFRAAVTIPAAPAVTDPAIPGFADVPRGFAETLNQAPTNGAVTFLRRKTRTNAAAQWKAADGDKPASSYEWEEATAPLAWIAHHTPLSKTEASDWNQLDSIVRNEMLIGLSQAKSVAALTGANAAGITGVVNTVGIQAYAAATDGKDGDTVYDTIRRMATKVYLVSGFRPTHVAMSPQVKEDLDLLKAADEHYLAITVGDKVWNLQIVEDTGLTTVEAVVGTHNSVIVYANVGATWYTKEQDNVEVGLVDDQFINNAYTLLAEGRNALAVKYPDAFCYCEDAIAVVAP